MLRNSSPRQPLWSLALRSLRRDARSAEMRLLLVAIALGVTALSSVAFLADRLQAGLQRDAAQLLGGDAVVVTDQPPASAWLSKPKCKDFKASPRSVSRPWLAPRMNTGG
jgi:putative ABC transport system permease protein